MKQSTIFPTRLCSTMLGLGLSCLCASAVQPIYLGPPGIQPNGDPNDANNNGLTYSSGRPAWASFWSGAGTITASYDTTIHSSNNIPGSIHYVLDCQGAAPANMAFGSYLPDGGWWLGDSAIVSASVADYKTLGIDIYIDTTLCSNLTSIPLTVFSASYGNTSIATIPTTNTGWQHLEIALDPGLSVSSIAAIGFYEWYNATASTPPAHLDFWVDNIRLLTNSAPVPPPTLGAGAATGNGLLFDAGPGDTGAGGDIYTIASAAWLNATAANPVTYSLTIPSAPDPAVYSNVEAHILLATGLMTGNWQWNATDIGYLKILDNSDGTATATMLWKTNQPYANNMFTDGTGTLGTLTAPTLVGTWSITFKDSTTFTVKGPGNTSTDITLPQAWFDSFTMNGNNATAVFGMSATNPVPLLLGKVSVSGPDANWTNDFSSLKIDSTTWGVTGNETVIVTPQPAIWVNWTLPDVNYTLEAAPVLGKTNTWSTLTGNTNLTLPVATYRWGTNHSKALVLKSDLPGTNQTYLRLEKRMATKLQVLMPGETNAPNTTTGKTGTPIDQPMGTTVTVTINAVDSQWNIVSYNKDAISLTASDSQATSDAGATLPITGRLASGTATLNVVFYTPASQTVTVSDTDSPNIVSGTSASVTVTQ